MHGEMSEFPFKTKPYGFQHKIWEETKDRRYYGFFYEMGMGKTKLVLDTAAWLHAKGEISGMLVLAPSGIHDNWVSREVPTHLGAPHVALLWDATRSRSARWGKRYNRLCAPDADDVRLKIFSLNIEAIRTPRGFEAAKKFAESCNGDVLIVCDESTCIKNPKAAQTKAALRLRKYCKYARILTGTPITQGPLDLWSQTRFLSTEAIPFPSYTAFKNMFSIQTVQVMGNRRFLKIVGYQNMDYLKGLLKPFTDRKTKSECLDLPEKIYTQYSFPLSAEQRKMYDSMRDQCIVVLEQQAEEGIISATNVLTQMTKLAQIASGFIKDEDEIHELETIKTEGLRTLVETAGDDKKWIIWCPFLQNIWHVTGFLASLYAPESVVSYYGETTASERHRNIQRFQNDDTCRFFVSNRTGSEGITLTAAHNVVYWGNTFRLDTRLQSEDRCHRIGQHQPVTYVDLVARGTIDEYILKALRAKQSIAHTVLDEWRNIL
jgi:hypothetical protein